MMDLDNNILQHAITGEHVKFSADVINENNFEQDFAYLITTDEDTFWFSVNTIGAEQTIRAAAGMTFDSMGVYTIDVYLLASPQQVLELDTNQIRDYVTDENNHLASPASIQIKVKVPAPRHQVADGTPPSEVICNEGLELIFKASDGSPACVKPDTASKLAQRGWSI